MTALLHSCLPCHNGWGNSDSYKELFKDLLLKSIFLTHPLRPSLFRRNYTAETRRGFECAWNSEAYTKLFISISEPLFALDRSPSLSRRFWRDREGAGGWVNFHSFTIALN